VPLERQPALALEHLIISKGALVTRDELAEAIWPATTHVKIDDSLNYCVRQIRTALDDDAKSRRFIVTVPRRGYRFVAPIDSALRCPARGTPFQWAGCGRVNRFEWGRDSR